MRRDGRDDTYTAGTSFAYHTMFEMANIEEHIPLAGCTRDCWEFEDKEEHDQARHFVTDPHNPEDAWIRVDEDGLVTDPDAQGAMWRCP